MATKDYEKASNITSLLAVIVLYKMSIDQCVTLSTLTAASTTTSVRLHVLLIDNSPAPEALPAMPINVSYLSVPANLGLANAYNRAIELAESGGYSWLLTLDQDTELPLHFIGNLDNALRIAEGTPGVAAVVPQIIAGGRIVSPNFFQFGAIAKWYKAAYVGVPKDATYAFNSAATIRVDALRQAGGYDPYFWLDNSDAQIFDKLWRLGKLVYVAGDLQVHHDFSMKNMSDRISPWRYEHILLAESAFWDAQMNRLAGAERTTRLAFRLIKQLHRKDSPQLRRVTWRFLCLRLFHRKAYRTRLFKSAVELHLSRNFKRTTLQARTPKISVCMAAYNGEPYIREQLESILPQLAATDEVVIVDDASIDGTVLTILGFNDARIRIFRHARNKGLIETFEDAIRAATGDILFLADNDDRWAANKVERFMAEFRHDPAVTVVISAVSLIDGDGFPLEDTRWSREGKFQAGFVRNIFRNSYQGSAMAFRASLIASILPIPRSRDFLHDVWIGTCNDAIGGKTAFIPEPLLFYRRHGHNASGKLRIMRRLSSRSWLLIEHLRRLIRKR